MIKIRQYLELFIDTIKDGLVGPFDKPIEEYDSYYEQPSQSSEQRDEEEIPRPSLTVPAAMPEPYCLPDSIALQFPKQLRTADEMIADRKAKRNTKTLVCEAQFSTSRFWKMVIRKNMDRFIADLPDGTAGSRFTVTLIVEEEK